MLRSQILIIRVFWRMDAGNIAQRQVLYIGTTAGVKGMTPRPGQGWGPGAGPGKGAPHGDGWDGLGLENDGV